MFVPVDYPILTNIAPAVPLLFLVPFAVYVLSMPIGAMALGSRHYWRKEPLWVRLIIGFGTLAQLTFFPYGMLFWLVVLNFVTGLIGAHEWQVLALHALLFSSAFGSFYLWGSSFAPRLPTKKIIHGPPWRAVPHLNTQY